MRILVTGASGQLGAYLLRELAFSGAEVVAWSSATAVQVCGVPVRPVDLGTPEAVARAFREARPTAVIHAAAVSSVAACHRDPHRARQINTDATALLAQLAAESGTRLLMVSTDLIFDGERGHYGEEDAPSPLSIYGRSKAAAEQAVLAYAGGLVVRLSLLFGPTLAGRPAFFDQQVQALRSGRPIACFADEWRTPLDLYTAAQALVGLAQADCTGALHVGGPERLSRLEMGQRLASFLGTDAALVVSSTRAEMASPEPRPRDTSLKSGRWRQLFPEHRWPGWHEAMQAMAMA